MKMINQIPPAAHKKLYSLLQELKIDNKVAGLGLEITDIWILLKMLSKETYADPDIRYNHLENKVVASMDGYGHVKEPTLKGAMWWLLVNVLNAVTKDRSYSKY